MSTNTTLLQLIDQATGENENSWGDVADANFTKLENAIAKSQSVSSTGGTTTLTDDQSRNAMLVFSGALASDHIVEVSARTKMWLVRNNHTLSSYALKFRVGALGTPVTVPQGVSPVNLVFCDGADIYVAGVSEASVDAKVQAAAKLYGASVGGTANAITLDTSPAGYARTAGNLISFIPSADNTGAVTVNPEGLGAVALNKQTPEGAVALTGGELQAGHEVVIIDNGTTFQLIGDPSRLLGTMTDIASATTTDLGTVLSHVARVTGTTTITGLGSSASTAAPIYLVRFAGILTFTHNVTSLILPGSANITTAANDLAILEYLGSGNWRCLAYFRADGTPLIIPVVPLRTKTSGGSVCLQRIHVAQTASQNCTTDIPFDNTIPQNTEGDEVFSQAVTPLSASSYLLIKVNAYVSRSGGPNNFSMALFVDSTADALAAAWSGLNGGGAPYNTFIGAEWKIASGSTSARTYKIRAGGELADIRWNGDTGGNVFSTLQKTTITIEEWLDV
jgi:hypothetical protein